VEALVGPPVMLSFGVAGEPRLLMRLLIQARALPNAATSHAIFEQYDALAVRIVEAMLLAEPALPRELRPRLTPAAPPLGGPVQHR
jgi:hypothetical protein